MRDGSTRRRSTSPQPTTWAKNPPGRRLATDARFEDLRALAKAHGISLVAGLLYALLEELHVSDDFQALVGRVPHLPATSTHGCWQSRSPSHSWCPLPRAHYRATRVRADTSTRKPYITRASGHRRRGPARTPLAEPPTRRKEITC